MEIPMSAPSILAEIMRECWQEDPKKRPTFEDICDRLQNIVDGDESDTEERNAIDGHYHTVGASGESGQNVKGSSESSRQSAKNSQSSQSVKSGQSAKASRENVKGSKESKDSEYARSPAELKGAAGYQQVHVVGTKSKEKEEEKAEDSSDSKRGSESSSEE